MQDPILKFRHEVIDPNPPGAEHDVTLIVDVNGNGRNDIIIGGKQGDPHVFWYENPTWKRHDMVFGPDLEAGGVVIDVNRDGRPDVVVGQQGRGKELYWFENPEDPTKLWPKHLITSQFERYHDQAVGDIDGDGEPEILISSQNVGVIAYFDIPEDPTVSPWPDECCHILATDMPRTEGLCVVDIDGHNELIVGPNIFWPTGDPANPWRRESFAPDLVMTRVAVADLNGDGKLEIVLCEGESHPGKLLWVQPGSWERHILREDLFHPHSLEIADFDGDGKPDIFVAEMGLGRNEDPKMIIYHNQGGGDFREVIIQRGVATHESKVGDLTGNGKPDIVGKPYNPQRHINVWFNES